MKYGVLAVLVVGLPFFLGERTALSFCRFCPASALQVTIPALLTEGAGGFGVGTTIKLAVLGSVLALAVFNSRFFCRVLCPIAALLAPFNHVSWLRVGRKKACVECSRCDGACPIQVEPLKRIARGVPANRNLDCIGCRDCISVCAKERRTYPR